MVSNAVPEADGRLIVVYLLYTTYQSGELQNYRKWGITELQKTMSIQDKRIQSAMGLACLKPGTFQTA